LEIAKTWLWIETFEDQLMAQERLDYRAVHVSRVGMALQVAFRVQRRRDIKMADWTADLDKFLADTELPVLMTAGAVSHEEALDWAGTQYDAFAERRRVESESEASARYLEDLAAAAKLLENTTGANVPLKPRGRRRSRRRPPP
jgi:hypothetical protein